MSTDAPVPELSPREKALILAGIMIGMFLSALNTTTVVTALPRIVANLGGMHLYSWVFASYMLGSTSAVPICGKLSDLLGRRPVFLSGLALFSFASALSGLAQSMEQLVIFRGLQGLAAAAIMPLVMITIGDIFPPAERGRFQGATGALWAVASLVGPLVGGFLVDNWSWRWVFFINLPLGLLAILVAFHALKKLPKAALKPSIDYAGMAAFSTAVVSLLLGFLLGGTEYPWESAPIVGLFALFAVALATFLLVEARAREPIIPLALFKDSIFTVSIGLSLLVGVAMYGTAAFAPLLLQGVLGTSATASGLLMMPQSLGLVAGSTLGGFIVARVGYRVIIWAGSGLITLGLFILASVDVATPYETVLVSMSVLGLGLGAVLPTLAIIVQNAIRHAQMGIATSAVLFFRQVGGALGVTLLGAFLTLRLEPAIASRLPDAASGALNAPMLKGSLGPQALVDPARAADMPPALLEVVRAALAASLNELFLLALGTSAVSLLLALFLREIPLKKDWRGSLEQEEVAPEPAAGAIRGVLADRLRELS